mmetsp:Transcript_25769/g.83483  ORF Transcript_25769/g.83483 Transcript_25769/m.83483 type:complete len:96 (+) Transcript_25769:48-335(+)
MLGDQQTYCRPGRTRRARRAVALLVHQDQHVRSGKGAGIDSLTASLLGLLCIYTLLSVRLSVLLMKKTRWAEAKAALTRWRGGRKRRRSDRKTTS